MRVIASANTPAAKVPTASNCMHIHTFMLIAD